MAEPDIVARLIAAGSALFTAANMAVSYATYRRKRPAVKLCHPGFWYAPGDHMPIPYDPSFSLVLKNRSEVDVTIASAHVDLYVYQWGGHPRRRRSRTNVRQLRLIEMAPLHSSGGEKITLEPFGRKSLSLNPGPCTASIDNVQPVMAKLRVELSNGQCATSPKFPVRPHVFVCSCGKCTSQGPQLTFDDLAE